MKRLLIGLLFLLSLPALAQDINTLDDLKHRAARHMSTVFVSGSSGVFDGLGGNYKFDSTSTATPIDPYIIQPMSLTRGRWKLVYNPALMGLIPGLPDSIAAKAGKATVQVLQGDVANAKSAITTLQQQAGNAATQQQLSTAQSTMPATLASLGFIQGYYTQVTQTMPVLALGALYSFDVSLPGVTAGMGVVVTSTSSDLVSSTPQAIPAAGKVTVNIKASVALGAASRTFNVFVFKNMQ